ncbi:MAG: hypothetical protein ACE3L7_04075 [Candidatus Pristimantibacillus sp.]
MLALESLSNFVQLEWLPKASQEDIKKTKKILTEYSELKIVVDDYRKHEEDLKQTIYEGEIARRLDQEDLYANKTANAAILANNQQRAAEECDVLKVAIERAVKLIRDDEAQQAITLRYIKGYSYTETLLFLKRGEKSSTLDRRLIDGMTSVANTLKMWGIIE